MGRARPPDRDGKLTEISVPGTDTDKSLANAPGCDYPRYVGSWFGIIPRRAVNRA